MKVPFLGSLDRVSLARMGGISAQTVYVLLAFALIFLCGPAFSQNQIAVPGVHPPAGPATTAGGVTAQPSVPDGGTFLAPPRELLRLLEQARALLAAKRYSEAVERLQEVLESSEDYFVVAEGASSLRSFKAEALRLLRGSPNEVREAYRLRYATRAKRLLEEAVQGRHLEQLIRLAAIYPLTEAGQMAAILAAYWLLQEGELEEAAALLEALRQESELPEHLQSPIEVLLAGCYLGLQRPAEASAIIACLQERMLKSSGRVGGPPANRNLAEIPMEQDLLQWISQTFGGWRKSRPGSGAISRGIPYFGGEPGRNSPSFAGAPLLTAAWRARTAEYPEFDDLIRQLERMDKASGRPVVPAGVPLVVDQKVIVRTLRGVAALDLASGKRLWESSGETGWEQFLRSSSGFSEQWLPLMEQALRIRMWWDATSGGLSSDGKLVFSVEDSGLAISAGFPIVLLRPGGSANVPGPREVNSLVAYEVATGRRCWELRGESGEDQGSLGKIFFLGPPLPLRNRLYVLGVAQGEVRLLELEAASGRVSWQVPIARVEEAIAEAVWRRTAGLTPSYGRGILVCPTGAGAVVGVDLLRRQLAWVTRYSTVPGPRVAGRFVWMESAGPFGGMRAAALPAAAPLIAEDRVIVAPSEGTEILCLDLRTGALQWRIPRQDILYVACVHEGHVVVVEPRGVLFLTLEPQGVSLGSFQRDESVIVAAVEIAAPCGADIESQSPPAPVGTGGGEAIEAESLEPDKPRERGSIRQEGGGTFPRVVARVELSGEARVAGLGYRGGDFYYLPLTTGDVAQIDLRRFQLRETLRPLRHVRLGNLVAWNGCILSQSAGSVDLFYDADWLRAEVNGKLANDPGDKAALYWAGQIRLWERDFEGAIECFGPLWQLERTARAFQSLRDAWFAALEADFGRFSYRVSEVESLFQEPTDRWQFLQLVAKGAEELGDYHWAWKAYRRLIELDWNNPGWVKLSEDWQILGSQWVRSRLSEMLGKVPADLRGEILQFATQRKPKEITSGGQKFPQAFGERWLRYFFGLPESFEVALALAEAYVHADLPLTSEFWYRQVLSQAGMTAENPYSYRAKLGLLQLYRQTNNWAALAACLRETMQLENQLSGDSLGGVHQICEQFRQQPPVEAWMLPAADWPRSVQVHQEPSRGGASPHPRLALTLLGGDGNAWGSVPGVFLISGRPLIVGYDSYGRRVWEYSWAERAGASPFSFVRGTSKALPLGHLLVITGQGEIVAIDTLNVGPQGRARLAWAFDVLEMQPVSFRPGSEGDSPPRSPEAASEMVIGATVVPKFFEVDVAAVGGRYVAIKRANDVVLLEAISGEVLWRRSDLAADTLLAASEHHLFLVHPQEREVVVLRAETGELAARVRLPGEVVGFATSAGRSFRHSGFDRLPTYGSAILCWELLGGTEGEATRRLILWDIIRQEVLWRSPPVPEGSAMTFGGQQLLGIWQPDGLLRLFRLPHCQLFSEVRLPRLGQSDTETRWKWKLELLCNSWQVLVLGYRGDWEPASTLGVYAPPGLQSEGIRQGVLYAFDWEGRPMWPDPVVIENQWLPWDQPPEIPLLIFASYLQPSQSGIVQGGPELAMLGIDRRTGQQVLEMRFRQPGVGLEIEGSPEERAVRIKLQRSTTVVRFVEAGPKFPAEEEGAASSNSATGIPWWELIRRAAGEIFERKPSR